jgi:hypothetical protein
MSVWGEGKRGRRFLHGTDAPLAAQQAALECGHFSRDYEEECFALEAVSCYNCRYRRWTSDSFECMKG